MTKFMDVHHGMKGITAEQLSAAHRADLAIESEEGVHFEQAWADPEAGTVYCLSEAPSKEAVMRIHERAGHPVTEVHPVPLYVS
ncbi:SCO4226 family nickel-binding protein [Streptomyces sp. A3M-1-3]|uniref:SCO4226 family nickel-binding protein n=1 Tax=Streptomyces sp. A3M-1-3 TaxID=2962044 RepID=UPI0020B742A0|nr:SCO4226 family nickel-binding protein [Streptomyces sp. A3M-1-3]MCP3819659.1 SCO4226 family nickel-binding protein [Streptomyces sp. A3M-1-3]